MNYFKKILRFALPYKKYGILNIIFNVLYALFGTLSFISLIPMLQVLLKQTEPIRVKPNYQQAEGLKEYLEDSLNFFINTQVDIHGEGYVLGIMVGVVITVFFLKNVFGYLANFFITYLRNGVLQDIRNAMYRKILDLRLFVTEQPIVGV